MYPCLPDVIPFARQVPPSRSPASAKADFPFVGQADENASVLALGTNRHTLFMELAESGAGDQTLMDIAGHVSRRMRARYSPIRGDAKRKAREAL